MTRISHDPDVWQERADHLCTLLRDLAKLRALATAEHAREYLKASGTDKTREQAAKLAACKLHEAAQLQAAEVAAYQVMLDVWHADLAAGPAVNGEPGPAAVKLGRILAGEE